METTLKDKPENLKTDGGKGAEVKEKKGFQAFGNINTETEGEVTGEIKSTKVSFENEGQRLVGVLISRKQLSMEDEPWIYEVENVDGLWSFWGSDFIDGRMEEVPENVILDITYLGEKPSRKRHSNYKSYRIKYYPLPDNFDREKWAVSLATDGKEIEFIDLGEDF